MLLAMQAQTKTENWCGVLQEVALPGTYGDPDAFLEAAVRFANEDCWGTLSCAMMVRSIPRAVLVLVDSSWLLTSPGKAPLRASSFLWRPNAHAWRCS